MMGVTMSDPVQRILIVEDDISSQQYYGNILGDLYELTFVATVNSAKRALNKERFHIAIVDLSLPGDEDGIDLLKFLRHEYGHALPAIAISAHVFPQNREDALAAGAVAFHTKPIMSGDLLTSLQKHMGDNSVVP
jgi:CheY-like chemotaxis protein